MEDGEIVKLYLDRDETAIAETGKKYGEHLRGLSFAIVRDNETARECENDTYLRAWNSIPPHEPSNYLGAFLSRITRRLSLNRLRDDKRLKRGGEITELTAELEQCIPAPGDASCKLEEDELKRAINGFLGALPEKTRAIFLRRYWFLDSLSDIEKRFGMKPGAAKSTLFRLREKLRKYLVKEGFDL